MGEYYYIEAFPQGEGNYIAGFLGEQLQWGKTALQYMQSEYMANIDGILNRAPLQN